MNYQHLLFLLLFIISVSCNDKILNVHYEKGNVIQLSSNTLSFLGCGGFRYVTVDGREWWVNRIVVQDSAADVSRKERAAQRCGDYWSKSCAWLTVERTGDSLTIRADAEKKTTYDEEHFQIEIRNRDTSVVLKGTLGGALAGGGDDISPSMRNVVFNRNGGKVRIELKGGEVFSVTVDGKNPQGWSRTRPDLNNYTCDWLTVRCVPGKTLELEAAENHTEEIRTFSLSLVHFDSYAHVQGFQHPAVDIPSTDTIGFIPDKVYFPLKGGTVEVVARTDGWVLDEKSYGLDWLTIEQNGNRLKLTATPNFDYAIRHFTFRFKKGDYYEYLEGEQERR